MLGAIVTFAANGCFAILASTLSRVRNVQLFMPRNRMEVGSSTRRIRVVGHRGLFLSCAGVL